jgi:hypothetical protein
MASDPPLRERRMLRDWAHGLRSSAKGKKDVTRLGLWPQFLPPAGRKDVTRLGPWLQILR